MEAVLSCFVTSALRATHPRMDIRGAMHPGLYPNDAKPFRFKNFCF